MELNKIYHGECLKIMKDHIPNQSIDMILCDLPYGVTDCSWDSIIPIDQLWEQYRRIIKNCGVIALTATQPFATDLINEARDWFKYEYSWINESRPLDLFTPKINPSLFTKMC